MPEDKIKQILKTVRAKRTTILIAETAQAMKKIEEIQGIIETGKEQEEKNILIVNSEEFLENQIIVNDSTLILKNLDDLLITHPLLATILPYHTGLNIIVEGSLARDYNGLPENSLLRSKNTLYLLLDDLLQVLPVRALDLEPMDSIILSSA